MKYLITGGCGFIGCNFANKLLSRGEQVILLDNLSRKGTKQNLKYLTELYPTVEFLHADIRTDFQKILEAINKVDVVFHLAGQVAVTFSVVNPREDFESNALGTFNILEAIRISKKRPLLIYASTNKVYGKMDGVQIIEGRQGYKFKDLQNGISEKHLLDFHSPYGCSKGAADQYVRDYARMYGLKTVVMRQSCIYGPRQLGIEDQGWVAWFTIAAAHNKKITIYGNGKQVRDILHVDDLFNAWDLAVENIDKVTGEIFNIGGGRMNTVSLIELINLLEKISKRKIKQERANWRPGDQKIYISDNRKIAKKLGWRPMVSVESGIRSLRAWVIANKSLFKDF